MPATRIRLIEQTPEGGPGDVRTVSLGRARDLVRIGQAVRVDDAEDRGRKPARKRSTP